MASQQSGQPTPGPHLSPKGPGLGSQHLYGCRSCPKRFNQLSHVQQHTRHTHTGLRPFWCPLCQRSFSLASHLRAHLYRDRGERFFSCLHCGLVFARLIPLRQHLLHEHGQEIARRARNYFRSHAGIMQLPHAAETDIADSSTKTMVGTNNPANNTSHSETCRQSRNGAASDREIIAFKKMDMAHCTTNVVDAVTNGRDCPEWAAERVVDVTSAKKQKEELSHHAAALVHKLKHATDKLAAHQKCGPSNNSAGSECRRRPADGSSEDLCNRLQNAPECSPKDSGVDVSSPWPRELEGTDSGCQSGAEQSSHTGDNCREQNNNSEKRSPKQKYARIVKLSKDEGCEDETDSNGDTPPPVLEKEPPILDMVQPALFTAGLDEPSDLSEEEAVDEWPESSPGGRLQHTDSEMLTPESKLKNDVCLTVAQSLSRSASMVALSRQNSSVLGDNSSLTFSPGGSVADGFSSSQQSIDVQAVVGMDISVGSLFPDLGDMTPPRSQSQASPGAATTTAPGPSTAKPLPPAGFQSEFAKFLQDRPTYKKNVNNCWSRKKLALGTNKIPATEKRRSASLEADTPNSSKRLCTTRLGSDGDGVFPLDSSEDDDYDDASRKSCSISHASDAGLGDHSQVDMNLSEPESQESIFGDQQQQKLQQQQQHKAANSQLCSKLSAPLPRINVRRFLSQQKKIAKLRRLVCRLFKSIFPLLPYPRKFNQNTPVVEYLMDQVMDAVTGHTSSKPKALCLDSDVHDVSIVLCKMPIACIRHLRRKIYQLLCTLLPDLTVDPDFNASSQDVDKLLSLVVRCNTA